MEIDELRRNLENKKESQKATAEKLPPPSELSYHSNDNRYAGRGGVPPGEVSYNNDNPYSGRGGTYNDGSAREDEQMYGHNDGAPCRGHGGNGSARDE